MNVETISFARFSVDVLVLDDAFFSWKPTALVVEYWKFPAKCQPGVKTMCGALLKRGFGSVQGMMLECV